MKIWSWVIALIFVCSLGLSVAPVIAETRITDVSATAGGCGIALNDNGTIWLWGSVAYNDDLGLQPIIMPGMDHIVAISGDRYPVVLKDDGTVWLIKNYPIFENASRLEKWPDKEPVKVDGFSDITAISGSIGGYGHNLIGLRKDGTVWATGNNRYGQLGTDANYGDDFYSSTIATQVKGLSGVKAISMGDGHALALKKDGTVWAWGMNNMGQLGDGTISYDHAPEGKPDPAMVKGLTGITAIAAGREFSLALKDDGTVWAWGRRDFGMLGDGLPENVGIYVPNPVQVKGLTNVTNIAAGQWFALALRDDGTVWTWGDNRFNGMLGDGTLENRNVPVQVKGLSGIVSVSAGSTYCLALDKNGVIWAWGDDSAGQLGDGKHGANLYRATADKVPFSEALAGPEINPGSMASPRPPVYVNMPVQDNSIEYMAVADNLILAFGKNSLTAMDINNMPKWNISIPGAWTYEKAYCIITEPHVKSTITSYVNGVTTSWTDENSTTGMSVKAVPIFAAESGHIYLYAFSNVSDSNYYPMNRRTELSQAGYFVGKDLIAIAPDGTVEWTRHFVDDIAVQDNSHVEAHGDRIYLYRGYNETVLDKSGNILFTIENISNPVSVDENGYMYAVKAVKEIHTWLSTSMDGVYFDYRTPSNVIEAYAPDGKLSWHKELENKVAYSYFLPAVWNEEIGIPLYHEGMLYVPQDHGIMALNKDGTVQWTKIFDDEYRLFYLMPIDSKGDLYLYYRHSYPRYNNSNMTVIAIKPNGDIMGQVDIGPDIANAFDGVLYMDGKPMSERDRTDFSPDDLDKATILAYDMVQGKYIWSFKTPTGDTRTLTVNVSNVLTLFPDYSTYGIPAGSIPYSNSLARIIPSDDLTYIYFRTAAWDEPVVYNMSTYTYYSALYALDKDGKLVWQKPMDTFVTAAAANNTTIYYGTNGGGISVSTIEVVAGLAIAASVLLFIKFFALGSVTRARSRLDKNDNRNKVYRFIAERPGSTLYETSKEMGLNIGTLRYHLMILSLNHRIVTYNDDGKFVRYFTNSNTYGKEDQMVISLLRRDSMGKILKLILESGEMTNGKLCGKLGLPESAISKYLSELTRKGIISKAPEQGVRASYSVKKEHVDRLSNAIKLTDSPAATIMVKGPLPQAET